jgi:hypothetical protein
MKFDERNIFFLLKSPLFLFPWQVEAFGVLIKFKMALPWKPRYQNNGVG